MLLRSFSLTKGLIMTLPIPCTYMATHSIFLPWNGTVKIIVMCNFRIVARVSRDFVYLYRLYIICFCIESLSKFLPWYISGNRITKQKVIDLNNAGKIERNLKNPPLKDTVIVPDAGFTLIRFLADNPGFWLLHCHISWHHRMGMAMMLQVYM